MGLMGKLAGWVLLGFGLRGLRVEAWDHGPERYGLFGFIKFKELLGLITVYKGLYGLGFGVLGLIKFKDEGLGIKV